jgi:hypothetical protein
MDRDDCYYTTCDTGSAVCVALSPVPDGTYRGDIPFPTTLTFASGAIPLIRVQGIVEETSPTDPNTIEVTYEAINLPASALVRDGARFTITTDVTRTPSWPGPGMFHLQIVPTPDGSMLTSFGLVDPAANDELQTLDGVLVRQ